MYTCFIIINNKNLIIIVAVVIQQSYMNLEKVWWCNG
jgi:hypothetical protein